MEKMWYYNIKPLQCKKIYIIELWQKMNDVKKQTGYLNITDAALRLIRKYYGKKTTDIAEKEKKI